MAGSPRLAAERERVFRAPAVVFAVGAYIAVLQHTYATLIAPSFTYLQYGYRDPDPLGYTFAITLAVALALLLPRRVSAPSHFIAWVLYVVAVLPSMVVPQFAPALSRADALELAIWVAVAYAPVAVIGTRGGLREVLPHRPMRPTSFWPLVAVVFVVLNGYVLAVVGLDLRLPSLDDVYGARAELTGREEGDATLRYVVPLLATVLSPLALVRGMWARRWTWVLAGLLGQLFAYSSGGNKTALFSPVALAAVYLLLRRRDRPGGAAVVVAAPVVCVAVVLLDRLSGGADWTSLIVRRFLVTPGLLTAGYVQVFDDAPKAHLAHSVLSPFADYPYLVEPPDLVGAVFFDNPETHANANLLADGFANFGYPGMVGACLVLVLLLWMIDDAARGLPLGFACLVFLMPALALADSGVLTSMLTHGFLAVIAICVLAPRDESDHRQIDDLHATAGPGSDFLHHSGGRRSGR